MFGDQYYNGVIRKYVIAFGSLFNDIVIQRRNTAGQRIQSIQVPIAYGPKEKFLVRLRADPNLSQQVALTLPRMGFEITALTYNGARKLSSSLRNVSINTADNNKVKSQYVPVPYDITFALSIMCKNADDGAQILEQIVPYFRPEFTLNIRLIPELNIVVDTPVVLQDISIEDTYEGNFEERRALVHTLNFSMKGYLYGPSSKTGIIKRSQVFFFQDTAADVGPIERLTVSPAQHANGAPMNIPGNTESSVALSSIAANSDYGFASDIEFDQFKINNEIFTSNNVVDLS
jgi:hypothetical protein